MRSCLIKVIIPIKKKTPLKKTSLTSIQEQRKEIYMSILAWIEDQRKLKLLKQR